MFCANIQRVNPDWVFLIVFAVASFSAVNVKAQTELSELQAANQAMHDVATARLELERFHLELLEKLHDDGNASWNELARQEVLVETLISQHQALAGFMHLVDDVVSEVKVRDIELAPTRHPVKLYPSGSRRLIGWIEADRVDEFVSFVASPVPVENAGIDEQALQDAVDRLQRAESKLQHLAHSESAPEHWVVHARLLRDLAHAEWKLCQLIVQGGTGNPPSFASKHRAGLHNDIQQVNTITGGVLEARSNPAL